MCKFKPDSRGDLVESSDDLDDLVDDDASDSVSVSSEDSDDIDVQEIPDWRRIWKFEQSNESFV